MNRRALLTGGSALALLTLPKPASAVCALPESNRLTPDERIETALATIKAALAEKYPGRRVRGLADLMADRGHVVVLVLPSD